MNIHNVVTFIAEISYYLGAFALLALFPFIANAAPRWPLLERYAAFIPNRYVFLVGAVTSAFSVKTWNVLLTQLAFYGSVAALVVYGLALSRAGRVHEAWLFTGSAVALAVVQVVLFINRNHMVRSWDDTEYKEFFIAIGLALFATQTALRLLRR